MTQTHPSPPSYSEEFTRRWVSVQSMVHSYIAASIRDYQHAEDLLQSVAMLAYKDFGQYDPARPFLAWVLAIARCRVIDFLRKSNRDRHVFNDEVLAQLADACETMHDELPARKEAMEQCMSRLQPRSRRILEMRYHRTMKSQQIARTLGLSDNAVFIALHRARAALVKCVKARLQEGVSGA